jgi:hypothetical protein
METLLAQNSKNAFFAQKGEILTSNIISKK